MSNMTEEGRAERLTDRQHSRILGPSTLYLQRRSNIQALSCMITTYKTDEKLLVYVLYRIKTKADSPGGLQDEHTVTTNQSKLTCNIQDPQLNRSS